jgi:hypothetical protein
MVYFRTKKSQFGQILEGQGMKSFGTFYSQGEYFNSQWYVLWSFGTLCPFLVCCSKKNLATLEVDRDEIKSVLIFQEKWIFADRD